MPAARAARRTRARRPACLRRPVRLVRPVQLVRLVRDRFGRLGRFDRVVRIGRALVVGHLRFTSAREFARFVPWLAQSPRTPYRPISGTNTTGSSSELSQRVTVALDQREQLVLAPADRHHQPSTIRVELLKQRLRNRWTAGGHEDGPIRPSRRPALGAVPDDDLDVVVAGVVESLASLVREALMSLDARHVRAELGEDRGLVPGARADLERPRSLPAATGPAKLGHARDDVRLADRLARADRHRVVAVRLVALDEHVARDGAERLEDLGVADPARLELLGHHARPIARRIWRARGLAPTPAPPRDPRPAHRSLFCLSGRRFGS